MWLTPPQDTTLKAQIDPVTHVSAEVTPEPVPESNSQLIARLAKKHGINPDLAIRVAKCESTLRHYKNGEVLRGVVNSQDVGIFQINEYYHLATSKKLGINIYTKEGNIEYAMYLIKKQGFSPWSASSLCSGVR